MLNNFKPPGGVLEPALWVVSWAAYVDRLHAGLHAIIISRMCYSVSKYAGVLNNIQPRGSILPICSLAALAEMLTQAFKNSGNATLFCSFSTLL